MLNQFNLASDVVTATAAVAAAAAATAAAAVVAAVTAAAAVGVFLLVAHTKGNNKKRLRGPTYKKIVANFLGTFQTFCFIVIEKLTIS